MLTRDPVCHMEIAREETKFVSEYQGKTYYFDSPQCQHAFEKEPEAFAKVATRPVYDEHGDRYDGSE